MARDLIAEIEKARTHGGDRNRLRENLVGSKQLWLGACRQAVEESQQSWLGQYRPEEAALPWPLGLMPYDNPEHPKIAIAMAVCAQAAILLKRFLSREDDLAEDTEIAETLLQAALQWQKVHLSDPGDVGEPGRGVVSAMHSAHRRADPVPRQVEAMMLELKQVQEDWQLAPVRDLVLFFLGCEVEASHATVRLPIPVELGLDHGLVATLVLESRVGPLGELYPDPRSMAFLKDDEEFQGALGRAWAYAHRWYDGHTEVRWTLSHPSRHLPGVEGASAGAGFALGLMHLLDPSRPPLDREWAITGDITPEGKFRKVKRYLPKLQAVRQRGFKLIVPADDLKAWQQPDLPEVLALEGAGTVEQASDIASSLLRDLGDYLEGLISRLSELPSYYPAGVKLDRIHQRVKISQQRLRYREKEFRDRQAARRAPHSDDEERERAYQWRTTEMVQTAEETETIVVDWEHVREQMHRVVILGDPGFGKTWLLQYEGCEVAKAQLRAVQDGEVGADKVILPIYQRLGMLTEELKESEGDAAASLLRLLKREPEVTPRLIDWAQRRLQDGGCLLLLDGLDEVPPGSRSRVAQELDTLARSTQNRIWLTSRIVGYQEAPFRLGRDDKEQEVELVAFEPDQVEGFISNWFEHVPERGRKVQAFLERGPAVRTLARIPLLLSFICLVGSGDEPIPTRRAELYETVLRGLLEGRWRSLELREEYPGRIEAKLAVLEQVAWQFATMNGVWHDLLPWAQLDEVILMAPQERYLRETSSVRHSQPRETTSGEYSLLTELSEQDGVLVKAGAPPHRIAVTGVPYLFLHRTFQEFLVSRQLARAWQVSRDQAWGFLYSRLHHPDWREPVLLLAAGVDQEDATQLTQRILTAGSPYEQVLERDLLLAGECLAWGAEVRPGLRHAILDRSLELYLRQVAFETDGASQGHVVHTLETAFGLLGEGDRDYLLASLLAAARPDDEDQAFVSDGLAANLASAPRRLVSLIRDIRYYSEAERGKYRAEGGYLRRRAAIRALGRLKLQVRYTLPVLLAALSDEFTRETAAEALGNTGPGTAEVVAALIDAQRQQRDIPRSAERIYEALGVLGQRHPEVVEDLLGIATDFEGESSAAPYTATYALCKAAETDPRAMTFVLEGWKQFYVGPLRFLRNGVIPLKRANFQGLKHGKEMIKSASPEVIRHLLTACREYVDISVPDVAGEFLADVVGNTPLVQCKTVGKDGSIRHSTLDPTEGLFEILLQRPTYETFSNVALTLLVRWGLNKPELIVRLINLVREADTWLAARLIEKKWIEEPKQLGYLLPAYEYAWASQSIRDLRGPDEARRGAALSSCLAMARSAPDEYSPHAQLPAAIEKTKPQILKDAYRLAWNRLWNAYNDAWTAPAFERTTPYVLAALACFRGWHSGSPLFSLSKETIRSEFTSEADLAISILPDSGRQAVEMLASVLADERVRLANDDLEKKLGENSPEADSLGRWRKPLFNERIAAAYALAQLTADYPEAQAVLLSNLESYSWRGRNDALDKATQKKHLVRALGNVSGASCDLVAALVEIAIKHDREVHFAGTRALSQLRDPSPDAVDLLVQAYKKLPKWDRPDLIEALGAVERTTEEIVKLLLKALRDKEISMRVAAAAALGNLKEPNAKVISALRIATKRTFGAVESLGKLADRISPDDQTEIRDQLAKTAEVLGESSGRRRAAGYQDDVTCDALRRIVLKLTEMEVARLPADLPVSGHSQTSPVVHSGSSL